MYIYSKPGRDLVQIFYIFQACEVEDETYRAVVQQRCSQTLQLSWQRVMVLGHQHDAIKTKTEENLISTCMANTQAAKEEPRNFS